MVVLDPIVMERARSAVASLARITPVRAAYVFGSTATGLRKPGSDIDLAAFADNVQGWGLKSRVQTVVQIQSECGDDIDLHLFPSKFLYDPPPASLSACVLRNGIPIEIPESQSLNSQDGRDGNPNCIG